MKICGCKNSCGCGENVVSLPTSCTGYPSCDNQEKCAESFDGECVVYTGDTLLNLTVPKGARLNEIVQRLVGAITNPGCNYPDSPCKSVIVASTKITSGTIALTWGAVDSNPQYQVQFRLTSSQTWTNAPAQTTTSYTIGGLVANSAYYVRVATVCGTSQTCFSVTLQITTKS